MTYTDGMRAPRPTESERAFHELTTAEREAISLQWLRDMLGPQHAGQIYKRTEEPTKI
jgi:hypothetical protein